MQGSYDEMELQDAYNQGRQAFRDRHGRDSNPFSSLDGYDVRREEWFQGWDDEAKLHKTA